MSSFAKEIYTQILWDSFTLDQLRYIFAVQNEPVFQSAIAELVSSGVARITTTNGGPELIKN